MQKSTQEKSAIDSKSGEKSNIDRRTASYRLGATAHDLGYGLDENPKKISKDRLNWFIGWLDSKYSKKYEL